MPYRPDDRSGIVGTKYQNLTGDELLDVCTEENVLVQLENLQPHPAVAAALALGRLKRHAWHHEIATGNVFAYDETTSQFAPIGELRPQAAAPPRRVIDTQSGDARFGASRQAGLLT